VDQVGALSAIELYKGETLVETLTDLSVREFTGLLSNNEYTIKVTYTYNLNDGGLLKSFSSSIMFLTYIDPVNISNMSILNSESVKVGDSVQLRLTLDINIQVSVTHVYMNDLELPVLFQDTNGIIIEFSPISEGGLYSINITGIRYQSSSYNYLYNFSTEYQSSIFIKGALTISNLYTSNGYDYIDVEGNEKLILELNNNSEYIITEITLQYAFGNYTYNQSEIEFIDSNHIALNWKGTVYWNTDSYYEYVWVKSVQYGDDSTGYSTLTVDNMLKEIILVKSNVVRNVTSRADLEQMEIGYVYRLMNDIDLLGVSWNPIEYYGILLGDGYTISNISISVLSQSSETKSIGLFSSFGGRVFNLGLRDVYISITSKGDVNAGALVGSSWSRVFSMSNISVENIIIIVKTNLRVYMGGIIGDSGGSTISNSYVKNFSFQFIQQEKYTTTLIFDTFIGGLAGSIYCGNLINSYVANGIITVQKEDRAFVGGLVGYGEFSSVINSIVLNTDINLTTESDRSSVEGIIGYESRTTVLNIYISNDSVLTHNNIVVFESSDRLADGLVLNTLLFYTNILKWSTEIWDFDSISYIDNRFPTLK